MNLCQPGAGRRIRRRWRQAAADAASQPSCTRTIPDSKFSVPLEITHISCGPWRAPSSPEDLHAYCDSCIWIQQLSGLSRSRCWHERACWLDEGFQVGSKRMGPDDSDLKAAEGLKAKANAAFKGGSAETANSLLDRQLGGC